MNLKLYLAAVAAAILFNLTLALLVLPDDLGTLGMVAWIGWCALSGYAAGPVFTRVRGSR